MVTRADIPPGATLFRIRKRPDLPDLAPGDLLTEEGPRIGRRCWQITYTEEHRVYTHVIVTPLALIDGLNLYVEGRPSYNLTHDRP